MATSGSLRLEIIEARLTRDTETFGKMDPYVVIETRHQKHRTTTKQGAGKTPRWNEGFDIDVKYIGDDMTIKVMDEDVSSDDTVRLSCPLVGASDIHRKLTRCFIILYRSVLAMSSSQLSVLVTVSTSGSPSSTKAGRQARCTSRALGGQVVLVAPKQVVMA